MSNPFEIKKYYIIESVHKKSCDENSKPSQITTEPSGNISVGPMNLTEVQIYLFNETSKLIVNTQLAHTCDNSGMELNKNKNGSFPMECSATFQNFSEDYLTNLKNTLNEGDSYTKQIPLGKTLFSNFAYTDSYINSKTTPNDWKPLCQRYMDIGKMLTDFSGILESINNSPEKTIFTDKYNEILNLYKQNNLLRKDLEAKLEVITNGERYKGSKEFLDSTVYVSVLWTILATTLLFYVFKKM